MRVFYQLVEFRNGSFSLNYQNTTEDYIYLQQEDEIANAEMVDCLAKTVVMASDPCLNLVYHTRAFQKVWQSLRLCHNSFYMRHQK